MLIEIRKIADEVGFRSKYLYTHPHLAESVARKMYWRFKEAIIGLKVFVQWKTGNFPTTKRSLKRLLTDSKDKQIVEIIEHWNENREEYENNPGPLLIKGLDFSQRILERIDGSQVAGWHPRNSRAMDRESADGMGRRPTKRRI